MPQMNLFDSLLDVRNPNSFWHEELRDVFKEIVAKILSREFTIVYCPNPKIRKSCLDAMINFLRETFSATIEEETAEEAVLGSIERSFRILKKKRHFSLSHIMNKNQKAKTVVFVKNPPSGWHEKESITVGAIERRYVLQWFQTLARDVLGEKAGRKFDSFQKKYPRNMKTLAEAIHRNNGGELEGCFQTAKSVFLLWRRCMEINGLENCLNCQRTCVSPVLLKTLLNVRHPQVMENAFSSDTSLVWLSCLLKKTQRERILRKATSFVVQFCESLYNQMMNENSNSVYERKSLRFVDTTTVTKVDNPSVRNLEVIASELGFCQEFAFAELVFLGQDMGILTSFSDEEGNRFLVPLISKVPDELSEQLGILGMCKATRKLSENISSDLLLDFFAQFYDTEHFERLKDILQGPRTAESLIILLHKQMLGLLERIGIQSPKEARQLTILINSIKEYSEEIRERIREQIMSLEKLSIEYLLAQHPFLIVVLEKYADVYPSITQPFRSMFVDPLRNRFLETEDLLQRILLSRFLEFPSSTLRKAIDINSLKMEGFVSAALESHSVEDIQPDPFVNHLIKTVFLCSMIPSGNIWTYNEFRRALHFSRYIGLHRFRMKILVEMERQGEGENPKILAVTEKIQAFLEELGILKGENIFEESYIEKLDVDNILANADYFMLKVYPKILELKTDILPSSHIIDVLESMISGNVLPTFPDTIRTKTHKIHENVDLEKLDGILVLVLDNASWIKVHRMIRDILHPDILLPAATTIPTTTAPGHLSIFLGVTPYTHQIYGNKVLTLDRGISSPIGIGDFDYTWFKELVDKRSIYKVWKDLLSKKGFRYKILTKHRFDNKRGLTCILSANRRSNCINTAPQLLFPNIKAVLNEKKALIIALYSLTDIDIYSKKLKDVGIEEIERAISRDYEHHVETICEEIRDLVKQFRLLVILTSDHGFVEGEVETLKLDDIIRPHFRARNKRIENQRGDIIGCFFPEEGRAINVLETRSGIAPLVGAKLASNERIWIIDESNAKSYGLPLPNGGWDLPQIPSLFLFARRNKSFGFSRRFRREHKGISLEELLVPIAIKFGDAE